MCYSHVNVDIHMSTVYTDNKIEIIWASRLNSMSRRPEWMLLLIVYVDNVGRANWSQNPWYMGSTQRRLADGTVNGWWRSYRWQWVSILDCWSASHTNPHGGHDRPHLPSVLPTGKVEGSCCTINQLDRIVWRALPQYTINKRTDRARTRDFLWFHGAVDDALALHGTLRQTH